MNNNIFRGALILVAAIIIAVLAYGVLNRPDQRSVTEKIGDAIHEIDQGADKASRQLEDRTPGEKIGDAVEDAGDKIKENTQQ